MVPFPNYMLKSYPPVPMNMTFFGNRVFADIIKVMSLGWALI